MARDPKGQPLLVFAGVAWSKGASASGVSGSVQISSFLLNYGALPALFCPLPPAWQQQSNGPILSFRDMSLGLQVHGRVRETEAHCLTLITADQDLGVSKMKSSEAPMERGPTPSEHRSPTCVLGADTLQHAAGGLVVEGGDEDTAGETARRKRALHTLLNAHSSSTSSSKSRFTSAFRSVGGGRDPLDGYPSKSAILAMHRRGLESLAAKFPSVLPRRHDHIHRYFPLIPM